MGIGSSVILSHPAVARGCPHRDVALKTTSSALVLHDAPGAIFIAHLLLIDDDEVLIPKQVRQAFPAPNHRVEVARTGREGLARVRAEPPDVILLDMRLPDQSGLEVYQAIRRI